MSENTTENQETDTKVKTKSETEYAETEENKKTVSESRKKPVQFQKVKHQRSYIRMK